MRACAPIRLITVDGPAASGKSTVARALARRLNLPYLYTGAMYRAVTLTARARGVPLHREGRIAALASRIRISFRFAGTGSLRVFVDGAEVTRDLLAPEISRLTAAHTATFPLVRRLLVRRQRRFLGRRGLVAEGRDCGSVVFPNAPYKFFLKASIEERVRRRRDELRAAGIRASTASIRRDLIKRDDRDQDERLGKLVIRPDAWIVDNTGLSPEDTLRVLLRRIPPVP